ncbi:PepSY domain-containing protein [Rhodobacter lacus]|uniref:PepSY domain-containing protein n=1 Tax=Rhodobacter lacus TaxID=1641972 RepID=A0ABW5ABF8_9RHOB
MIAARLVLIALLAPLTALSARADDDHDRARRALSQGAILPLSKILPGLEAQLGARLLSAELDQHAGAYVYEFDLITPTGRIVEARVDARSGALLKRRGPAGHRAEHD